MLAIVKVGGGLATAREALERVGRAVAAAAGRRPVVVVPGGGPFADAVREFERTHGLTPAAAHWMAILAMDQYAYALADRVPGSVVVRSAEEIGAAHRAGKVPVLAPSDWMLAADVLPHSWNATSDSVAAFLAGALDAGLLVLVKPVSGAPGELTDPCFPTVVPERLPVAVIAAYEVERLGALIEERMSGRAAGPG
ncbi:MAG TPA: hypothetical protein VFU46_01715 [Gemmatimonadales bacterium]|nr:hypothetical protein [Gemmatimonadales bacterium]